ncbi:MAG: hypothetical protein PHT59_04560 [Candidatus Omnitrophica bacterium]|nr:hypothetical protein [Candidatus Omnitrophota bacterium]
MKYLKDEKGFYSLIGILVALALLFFFVYYVINTYFGSGFPWQQGTRGSNNAAVNYRSVINSTRENIDTMNTKTMEQLQQIDALKK